MLLSAGRSGLWRWTVVSRVLQLWRNAVVVSGVVWREINDVVSRYIEVVVWISMCLGKCCGQSEGGLLLLAACAVECKNVL